MSKQLDKLIRKGALGALKFELDCAISGGDDIHLAKAREIADLLFLAKLGHLTEKRLQQASMDAVVRRVGGRLR